MPTTRMPVPEILPDALLTRTGTVLAFPGSICRANTMLAANTGIAGPSCGIGVASHGCCRRGLLSICGFDLATTPNPHERQGDPFA